MSRNAARGPLSSAPLGRALYTQDWQRYPVAFIMIEPISETNRAPLPARAKLLLGLFGVLVSAGAIEAAFRIVSPALKPASWSDRPYAFFLPARSGTLQDGDPHPKQPGSFRVAVVGDSFTFGPQLQLSDTFPKQLERMLNENGGPRHVEVLNRGVSGTSTADQVEVVRGALAEDLDLLVLEVTLNDAEPHILSARERGALFGGDWLLSPIFSWWRSLGYVAERVHNSQTVRRYIDYHTKFFAEPESRGRFSGALGRIAAQAKEAGVPIFAVVFPLFDFTVDARYPFWSSHAAVGEELAKAGIPGLDLAKAYRNIPPARLQVVPGDDNHPNEIAHRIAAERLLAALIEERLVPAEHAPTRVFRERKDRKGRPADPARVWPRAVRGLTERNAAAPQRGSPEEGEE